MRNIDLGLVYIPPWYDLNKAFTYPSVVNGMTGGYFKTADTCYLSFHINSTVDVTLTFPRPVNAYKANITIDNTLTEIMFDGTIAIKANTSVNFQEVYKCI